MPRPLRHLGLALLARVEALPAALDPVGGGEDTNGGRIVWYKIKSFICLFLYFLKSFTWNEAADIMVRETAVGVGGPATGINKPLLQFYATIPSLIARQIL